MEESSSSSSSSESTSTAAAPTSPTKRKRRRKSGRVRTRAPPPPNFHRCLICLGTCTLPALSQTLGRKIKMEQEDNEDDEGVGKGKGAQTSLKIPGAETSLFLNRHLEQMFILRRLLEMPFIWCQETIQEHTEKVLRKEEEDKQSDPDKEKEKKKRGKGEDVNGDLNEWFNLCVKCSKRWVEPGWEIYQKILELEGQLNVIKGTVKETMKEKIMQKKRNCKWSGMTGNGVDVQVRKWIFPDLIVMKAGEEKKEEEEEKIGEQTARLRFRPSYKTSQEFITPDEAQAQDEDFNDDDPIHDQDYHSPCPSPPSSPPSPVVKKKSPPSKKSRPASKSGPRKRIRKPRRKFEDLKKFKCCHCSSYFFNSEEWTKHVSLHETPEKYHVCPQCTFPAMTPVDLEIHIKNRHERKKVRRCSREACKFTCKSLVKLEKHLIEVHQEEQLTVEAFSCENCGRTFPKRAALLIHQKKMHPELFGAELEEPVECDKCGEKFVSKILLGYHVERVHRFEGALKYQCDECGKGFLEKCKLDRHLTVHVNKTRRDFVCDICGLDYAYKSLLQDHHRKVHGGKGEGGGLEQGIFKCKFCEVTSPFKGVIDRHLGEHKEEMGNRCGKCGKCYVSESGLKRHLRLNHSEEKISVECPWCNKAFPNRDYMRIHERLYCKLKGKGGDTTATGEGVDVKLNLC